MAQTEPVGDTDTQCAFPTLPRHSGPGHEDLTRPDVPNTGGTSRGTRACGLPGTQSRQAMANHGGCTRSAGATRESQQVLPVSRSGAWVCVGGSGSARLRQAPPRQGQRGAHGHRRAVCGGRTRRPAQLCVSAVHSDRVLILKTFLKHAGFRHFSHKHTWFLEPTKTWRRQEARVAVRTVPPKHTPARGSAVGPACGRDCAVADQTHHRARPGARRRQTHVPRRTSPERTPALSAAPPYGHLATAGARSKASAAACLCGQACPPSRSPPGRAPSPARELRTC